LPNKDIGAKLQHPRRSLGNRHRSQAQKFLSISDSQKSNIDWAEQSAKQAVLHDFTHPENWRVLLNVKIARNDQNGIKAVLQDLFLVLGRDPELLEKIDQMDLVINGKKLFESALKIDPLDPDDWWSSVQSKKDVESFRERVLKLDFRDPRANILFARRLERLLDGGHEDMYLELNSILLSQRPSNHEAWDRMGKLHERRNEMDKAWLCYDQAETHMPSSKAREMFRKRMEDGIDGKKKKSWQAPSIESRMEFLQRMEKMASKPEIKEDLEEKVGKEEISEFERAVDYFENGRINEAFFIARRLATQGDNGALELAKKIKLEMDEDD
tara:strand:+ start:137574 stop:138554 length:981 start_codon:yes stop_codon:yes gene_type:complete